MSSTLNLFIKPAAYAVEQDHLLRIHDEQDNYFIDEQRGGFDIDRIQRKIMSSMKEIHNEKWNWFAVVLEGSDGNRFTVRLRNFDEYRDELYFRKHLAAQIYNELTTVI